MHPKQPSRRRRALLSVLAAAVVGTLAAVVGPPVVHLLARYAGQSEPVAFHRTASVTAAQVGPAPEPATSSVDPVGATSAPQPTSAPISGPDRVQTAATPTTAFTTLGIRLKAAPTASEPVQVRVHTNGRWSNWYPLDVNVDEGPDQSSAEHAHSKGLVSEPLWVGSADAYQVNAPVSSVGDQASMVLVRQVGTDVVVHDASTPAGAISPNAPAIHSRAEWGARAPSSALDQRLDPEARDRAPLGDRERLHARPGTWDHPFDPGVPHGRQRLV